MSFEGDGTLEDSSSLL